MIDRNKIFSLLAVVFLCYPGLLRSTTLVVNNNSDSGDVGIFNSMTNTGNLRGILNYMNTNATLAPFTVNFQLSSGMETITLTAPLPIININGISQITIDGSNASPGSGNTVTISGASMFRGFMIRQASNTAPVTIQNLTLSNCIATGGDGGQASGGGGMGAGGGLFVDSGCASTSSVILANIVFSGCSAVGGAGGAAFVSSPSIGGGGGGGMGGAGGTGGAEGSNLNGLFSGGGGGGLFGAGGDGGSSSDTTFLYSGGGGGGGGALGAGGVGGTGFQGGSANGQGGSGGGGGLTQAATGGTGAVGRGVALDGGSSGTLAGNILGGGGGGGGAFLSSSGSGDGGDGGGVGGTGGSGAGQGGGGGGGGSTNSRGSDGTSDTGGAGGIGGGGGGGGAGRPETGGDGGNGGGGGGSNVAAGNGGYGGGGGGSVNQGIGGVGGFGGGGGGTGSNIGGAGGFGGGGGASPTTGESGNGGFGAGGAGNNGAAATVGSGGSGGSSGLAAGGNGAGLGGSIFVNTDFAGNAVEIRGAVTSFSGSSVTGGTNGGATAAGAAASIDIHIMSSGAGLLFNPILSSDTVTIASGIGDDSSSTLPSGNGYVPGTGTGSGITKTGAGTLIFNGANNTYSGSTSIQAGKLQAGVVNAFSSSSVITLDSGATLDLNGRSQTIPSFTGSGGTITSASGSPILTITDDTSPTYAGTITGTLALNKTGTGITTLTGINTYTGATTINAGLLNVNNPGSITSGTTVNSGGNLGGNGTITGAVVVNSGGALTPGASAIGTLNIIGSLTLMGGSTTNIEVSPTTSALIAVTGTASVDGTLIVIPDEGKYQPNTTVTFLTSTSIISGRFSSLVVPGVPMNYLVSVSGYDTTALYLTLTSLLVPSGRTTRHLTGNEKNLALYLASLRFNPIYQPVLISLAALDEEPLKAALDLINPVRSTMDSFVASNTMFDFINIIHSRSNVQKFMKRIFAKSELSAMISLFEPNQQIAAHDMIPASYQKETIDNEILTAEASKSSFQKENSPIIAFRKRRKKLPHGSKIVAARKKENNCFWLEGFSDFSSQNGINQMPDLHALAGGAFLGYDYLGLEHGFVGVAAGYARSTLSFENHAGGGGINSYIFGSYGTGYFYNDDIYIELGLFGTIAQENNKRNVTFSGFTGTAFNNNMAYQLTPHFAIGYDYAVMKWFILEPFATCDCVINWTREIQEKGASPLTMRVQPFTNAILRTEIGVQIYQDVIRDWGVAVFREIAGYVNKAYFGNGNLSAAIVGAGGSFTFNGFNQTQNLLKIGLEMLLKANNGVFGALQYDGEFFSSYVSNTVQAKIGLYF